MMHYPGRSSLLFLRKGWSSLSYVRVHRNYSLQSFHKEQQKALTAGQPTPWTHPHLLKTGEVVPGFTLEDFKHRRERLAQLLLNTHPKSTHLLVVPSTEVKYMSEKIPYVFRQNSDFRYLTGCLEQDSALLIVVHKDSCKTLLFVRSKNQSAELWEGPRTGVEGAPDLFGVDEAYTIDDLGKTLGSLYKTFQFPIFWYDGNHPSHQSIHKQILLFLNSANVKVIESPRRQLHNLRVIKSKPEQEMMRQAGLIASRAIEKAMAVTRPGLTEHQLFATVDYHCRMDGAESLAYPPVVASGKNANTIHYINNNQLLQPNEILLMDAGAELHGYCSDITRCWPVSGKFSEPQGTLYDVLLETQIELIRRTKDRPSLDDLFSQMGRLLIQNLKKAKILKPVASGEEEKVAYELCPHHVSHYLGMDVHDTPTVPRSVPIRDGMVITVEPGIYLSENCSRVHSEFLGMGMRIEDDVLITSDGPEILTPCAKSREELSQCIENVS